MDTADPFQQPFGADSDTDLPADVIEAPEDSAGPAARAAAAGGRRKHARSLVRRVCSLTLTLHKASRAEREALAAILGCKSDTEALVVAAMEVNRAAVSRPSNDVLSIAGASDPFEAMIAATAIAEDAARFRAAWAALRRVEPGLAATAPTNSAKAGAAFAKAAMSLDSASRDRLLGPMALIG